MQSTIHQINDLLTVSQRRRAFLLIGVMLLIGLLQMGAVTSIMPFMAVVADPGMIERYDYIGWLYEVTGFDEGGFLIFLGSIVLVALVVTNAASALGVWMSSKFVWDVNSTLSKELLAKYLNRPYLWFVEHGSADAGKNILSEVERFSKHFLQPLVELLVKGTTAICLLVLIIVVDWKTALVSAGLLGGTYAGLYAVLRSRLILIGVKRGDANKLRFKAVQEGFGAFKETKTFQRESFFVSEYDHPTRRFSRYMVTAMLMKLLPRYLLELLAFGGLVVLVLYLVSTHETFSRIIPVLSLYALAGYRLLPALQHCFASLAALRFHQSLVADLHRDVHHDPGEDIALLPPASVGSQDEKKRLAFHEEIRFENVTFAYPGGDRPAVRGVSFSIPSKSMVAFCGPTGSGKSTIVDLILGLFSPQEGEILVDGVPLSAETISQWRRTLGYVPQHIFLSDSSIASNIAFGLPPGEIDMDAVVRAAKAAQIHDFIVDEIPAGYETIVGERGVRLSGGQRQRLGIARALYHDPDVLIFDEATSALDERTENRVMDAIHQAARAKTVILIAHRLRTVQECDRIFVVEQGHVVEQGLYRQLIEMNGSFSLMVNAR